jgi:hypothetical protein
MPGSAAPAIAGLNMHQKTVSRIKRVLVGLFALFIVIVLALVYLTNYSSPPPNPAPITAAREAEIENRLAATIEHPQLVPSTTESTAGDSKGSIAGSSSTNIVSMSFSQDDLNAMLADNPKVLAQMKAQGIQAARIGLASPNRVHINVWTDMQGNARQVRLSGVLSPSGDGGLTFHTDQLEFGLLPIPRVAAYTKIDSLANWILAKRVAEMRLKVSSVSVTSSALDLTGTVPRGSKQPSARRQGNTRDN